MHGKEVGTLVEENEGWSKYRPAIIVVTILVLIPASIFLYVYSERGLEGFIDWFFNVMIGLMFTGFMITFVFHCSKNCTITCMKNCSKNNKTNLI